MQETTFSISNKQIEYGKKLGEGGFGEVYRAQWNHIDVAVKLLALKNMSELMVKEFEKEIKLHLSLRSPQIVQMYGVTSEQPYGMVMEYMENGSLDQYLQNNPPEKFSWSSKYQVALDTILGLFYLHQNKVIHRDLKSLNILIDKYVRAKLADFGLAKLRAETMSRTQAKTGLKGTAQWTAPELFLALKPEYNEKTDLFSYGIVLWELASHDYPYKEANPHAISALVMNGIRETFPKDTPEAYEKLAKLCWDGKAENRPKVDEVIIALKSTINDKTLFSEPKPSNSYASSYLSSLNQENNSGYLQSTNNTNSTGYLSSSENSMNLTEPSPSNKRSTKSSSKKSSRSRKLKSDNHKHKKSDYLQSTNNTNSAGYLDSIVNPPQSTRLPQLESEEAKKVLSIIQKINAKQATFDSLGLHSIEEIKEFFGDLSIKLTRLHLNQKILTGEDCKEIKQLFPELKDLLVRAENIENNAFAHLKGMPLTSVDLSYCSNLTDGALAYLKGMPLTSVNFSRCKDLTDGALAHLKGMPLTSVNFSHCKDLTDGALAHLRGMPLTDVDFCCCYNLTDGALAHLKGMSLTSVKFSVCENLTDRALAHLKGMSLTSVNFSRCEDLTDGALAHLKGMPLTSVDFWGCKNLTDGALAHLKGMPLTSVDFCYCENLTDKALAHLRGMPLTSVNFNYCKNLTDKALAYLRGMPLTSVEFYFCYKLTGRALAHLKGMPLTSVDFSFCDELTDGALAHLRGMPLTSVSFSHCKNLTDKALAHLRGMPLTIVDFSYCKSLTDGALSGLEGMPLIYAGFRSCSKLTEKAKEQFQKDFPNCKACW